MRSVREGAAIIATRAEKARLKQRIVDSLTALGFEVGETKITPPQDLTKERIRALNTAAVAHRLERSKPGLYRHQTKLLSHFARGSELVPAKIRPRLVEVGSDSEEELLFRFASLHWSIPVSSGYGRRLRFLVEDASNGKLIGILGLGDPIMNLGARDRWIGWTTSDRNERLTSVMDAFVLGAVPPYSDLLCGKLVAMLVASDEVRSAFHRKYRRSRSKIRDRELDARLALVTTMSALGRSSIYNRIKHEGRSLFERVGTSQGSGEFQFSDGLYSALSDYAAQNCSPSEKKESFGGGFRSRRELIRKALGSIGLSRELIYHGIKREVYVAPLARNAREFLRGEHSRLLWHHQPAEELAHAFLRRWLIPRASRDKRYREFEPQSYALW